MGNVSFFDNSLTFILRKSIMHGNIIIKTPAQIEKMRIAGKLGSEVLDFITPYIQPGISTEEIDRLCHDYMVNVQKTIPAPLNYAPGGGKPYPKSICTSVNHVICHGIPDNKVLKEGDTLNIDITVIKDGYHGDNSRMFAVGKISPIAERLSRITYEAMWKGIDKVKEGVHLGDVANAIQTHAENAGYSVVEEFCGHGIGEGFHEMPQVTHYGKKGTGPILKAGMIFTIEPMINQGKRHLRILPDGWTAVTKDRSLSAQWEHTVLVTETGFEIMTLSAGSPPRPIF
jgi:methionyl aminopeptidase